MNPKKIFFALLCCITNYAWSQPMHQVALQFNVKENSTVQDGGSKSIYLEIFRMYISSVQLKMNDSVLWSEKLSYHLIDIADSNSLLVQFQIPESIVFNNISFNIGIDSITNVSGAMGGDLDPTNGMYWTWQSGYINFKIEGENSDKKKFQFHIGGYQFPNNSLQRISLPLQQHPVIAIQIDAAKFLSSIDLEKTNLVMMPGPEAIWLAKLFSNCISAE